MSASKNIMKFPKKSRYKPETADVFVPMEEGGADWLRALRKSGFDELKEQGLPTPKLERWKYTNLLPLVKNFGAELGASDVVYEDPDKLVQNMGVLFEDAPRWLIDVLSQAPVRDDMALWHLCNAYIRDGVVIDVPAGEIVDKPVEITITGHDGAFFVPRTVFRLGEGAELTVIEFHKGEGRYWNNRVTNVIVGPNARMRHYRIQENSADAVYTQNTHVQIERDGTYEGFTLAAGAALSRNQIHAELSGSNATCDVSGINILRGSQHGDTTLEIEHKAPHCTSHQFIRSVLGDQAHGVFQGKVYVSRGADKTDADQLSNALLLSEGAEMDTKPELEIYAEDVKCSHGATTGKLEDESLFYLRSRGVPEDQARALLIEAFVDEVADKLGDEAVREIVRKRVEIWLKK